MENQRVVLEIFDHDISTPRVPAASVAEARKILAETFASMKGHDRNYRRTAYQLMENRLQGADAQFKALKKVEEAKVTAQFPGKANSQVRAAQYKQLTPKWKHDVYDPIFKEFERKRFFGTMTLGSFLSEITIRLRTAKPPMELGYISERTMTLLSVGDKMGFDAVPLAYFYKQDGRFTLCHAGAGALPSVYRHRENGRHYVQDRYGIFIPRFLVRNLSQYDSNALSQGLKSRDGRSFTTKGKSETARNYQEKDFVEAVVRHLRAAQQGGSFFVSATSTSKHIYGSTGKNFYTPAFGQVLIDAALIPQDDLVDVHSPMAMEKILGMKKYDWTLEFSEHDTSYQAMAAARDAIRTREIVVHGSIPAGAIAKIRVSGVSSNNWAVPASYLPGGIPVDVTMDARVPTYAS